MSVLLVASVISMVTNSPEYGAWDAETVKFFAGDQWKLHANKTLINISTGCNDYETIS